MKNHFILFTISLFVILSCQTIEKKNIQKNSSTSFYVGTYTEGNSKGIYKYSLDKNGKLSYIGLAAISDNPSFLTKSTDGKFLIAVNEINNENNVGSVESFAIDGDSLKLVNSSSSGGAHPCFVTVNDDGYVLSANYTGGNIGLLRLNSKGELSELLDIQQHAGMGNSERQESPHAHSTWFSPDGQDIISVDLGTNELWFSHLDTKIQKLIPSTPPKLAMAPGAGPRHLTFHPNQKWIYVLNELNGTITLIEKIKDGTYKKNATVSTLPKGFSESNSCADIHISSDGSFVYASNRGHNSIAIFNVSEDGTLNLIAHESTRGEGPRNFSLSPDDNFLLVANQHTQNIISFKRNKDSGTLEFIDEIKAPSPVCILF